MWIHTMGRASVVFCTEFISRPNLGATTIIQLSHNVLFLGLYTQDLEYGSDVGQGSGSKDHFTSTRESIHAGSASSLRAMCSSREITFESGYPIRIQSIRFQCPVWSAPLSTFVFVLVHFLYTCAFQPLPCLPVVW